MAKILVVEDEPNNLELALRIVRHAGHEAAVATDGFAGAVGLTSIVKSSTRASIEFVGARHSIW